MLDHIWDYSREEFTAELEAWIGVDLDQPYVVVCVDHEV